MVIQNRLMITGAAFFALSLMGTSFGFLGTSLPSIRTFLGVDLEKAGLITSVLQFGFALTNLAGGILSDVIRCDKILMLGCFFLGANALVFGLQPIFSLNLIIMGLMGIGCGFILSSSNTLLVELYPQRKGRILNIHHVFFAVGSLLGPLIMGSLLSRQVEWQIGYEGLGLFLLALFIFFIFTRIPRVEARGKFKLRAIHHLWWQRDFLFLILVDFLAIGTQFALIFLSVIFLRETKGLSALLASIVLSSFFVFLALGRLLCGWLAIRVSNSKIILALSALLVMLLIAIWKGNPSISGTLFSDVAGTAMGFLAMTSGLGGMLICWLTGFIATKTSLDNGFIPVIISSLLAFILFLSNYRTFSKKEIRESMVAGLERHP
jgi:fucose permease